MAYKYKFQKMFTFEGQRYCVKANSMEELYEKMAAKKQELKDGSRILTPSTTVDQWSKVAYDTYKSSVKGLPAMKLRYDKYISPAIGRIPISKVSAVQCQGILNNCAGMSFSHVDKLRQELRFLFQSAMDNDLVRKNPAANITLPENNKGVRRSITDQERDHLYRVYKQYPPFILFILMLRCGCRPAEAAGLIGRDIDHSKRLLHIRGTKTALSDRYVPIPDDLYAEIKGVKPFEPICPNNSGQAHSEESYKKLRRRLKRELNISMGTKVYRNALIPPYALSEDFEPYCLRHTYCTDLCKAGVDVRTAQKLMGHATITITADIYTHIDQSQILDAGDKINEYFKRQSM